MKKKNLFLVKEWPNVNFEENFEKTLEYINNTFKEKGPFDGLFGFSMGGSIHTLIWFFWITNTKYYYIIIKALATILCSILENNNNKYDSIDFKFAIICATNVSPEEKLAHYYNLNKKIKIPTLLIIGESDKLIALESSRHLTEYFIDPKLFIHDQGHMIPRDSEAKKAYNQFFEEMVKKFN